ncbi:MAG: hypothetical protein LC101_12760 [Flavobacteriales bacterium]|nr:hypothetical protein [Flavobacteriales bacterium]MCZ2444632.1 hypothetical protein [Flavobacteriales bacterium]
MNLPTRHLFILYLCISYTFAFSQNQPLGARSAAMGNASVSLLDVWSSYNNQSALAWLNRIELGTYYETRFLLPELSTQGLALVVPIKKIGVFDFNFSHFGYTQYNENKFGITYARKFGAIFSAGIQINLHWIHIGEGYGDLVTATGELSFTVQPLPRWIIAAHVFNPTRTPLAEYKREKIPTLFRLGTSYAFHEKVLVCIEGEACIHDTPTFRIGLEYHAIPILFLRAGFNSYPVSPSFGFGLDIKNFKLNAASSWQPIMGFSPQVSLSYAFGK